MKRLMMFTAPALLLLASCATESTAPKTAEVPAQPARILMFYPAQAAFAPGDRAQVCYGVENATAVRLEPAVEEIRPLSNKCVWFQPSGSMDLTLIATGSDGKEVRETIAIAVKAGAPSSTQTPGGGSGSSVAASPALIQTFVATAQNISPGGRSTLCYVIAEPARLSMQPSSGDLGSDLKKCVLVQPEKTTTYTLTATAGGRSDKATVTVRVQ